LKLARTLNRSVPQYRSPLYVGTTRSWSVIKGTNLDFDNIKDANSFKTNSELFRAIVVYTMCGIPFIVKNSESLLNLSQKIIGEKATMGLVRATFFGHFCAGEDRSQVVPLMKRLGKYGVSGIMDYAAEEDVGEEEEEQPLMEHRVEAREGVVSARTYDYVTEEKCDANMRIMLQAIDMAAETSDTPFAAIKITALGKPAFLERTSAILKRIKSLWSENFGCRKTEINLEEFQAGLKNIGIQLSPEDSETLFRGIDNTSDGKIDYIEWTSSLQLEDMTTRKVFVRSGHNKSLITRNGVIPLLSEQETELMDKLMERVNTIGEAAYKKGVRLLIDAEQTYMQPMINHIALKLQRQYNKEKPIIYNTYQCYLKSAKNRIKNDIRRAEREGWFFAAKLVRGAYMVQERKRAEDMGYQSPICATIEETHNNYNDCVRLLLGNIDHVALMLATHNRRSIELAVERMKELDIAPEYGIYFGQLLGMSDNLTFPLGINGYKVFKYVPYGPIEEVLPYLIRRAQENSSILSSSDNELKMLLKEAKRRMFSKE